VRYFTRFTEESFAALVGIIFIFESLKKLYGMSYKYKVHDGYQISHAAFLEEYCHCIHPNESMNFKYFIFSKIHYFFQFDFQALLRNLTKMPV